MFAYCGNNPIVRKDADGEAFETALDVISLAASAAELAANPTDLWALASFSGDLIDVLIPFVGGLGETARVAKTVIKATDAADDLCNASKVTKTSKSIRSSAVKKAWKNEVERVTSTGVGSRNWTDSEIEELLTNGKVRGYVGHHMKSVKGYPELAGDPKNIQFLTSREHIKAHYHNWRNITHGRYSG